MDSPGQCTALGSSDNTVTRICLHTHIRSGTPRYKVAMANSSLLKAAPSRALTKTVQSALYSCRTPPLKTMQPSLVFHV